MVFWRLSSRNNSCHARLTRNNFKLYCNTIIFLFQPASSGPPMSYGDPGTHDHPRAREAGRGGSVGAMILRSTAGVGLSSEVRPAGLSEEFEAVLGANPRDPLHHKECASRITSRAILKDEDSGRLRHLLRLVAFRQAQTVGSKVMRSLVSLPHYGPDQSKRFHSAAGSWYWAPTAKRR